MHRYWKSGFYDGFLGNARTELTFNDDGTFWALSALHDDKYKVFSWGEHKGIWHEENGIIYTTLKSIKGVLHEAYYLKNDCLIPTNFKEEGQILRPVSSNELFPKELHRDTECILPEE